MPPIPPWSEFGLHVVVKPIGPICNLRCRYCFYREKKSLYATDESWRMTDETLEAYIRQYIEAQPARTEEIEFTFQGGEPTLVGLDFFRRALEPGAEIPASRQTRKKLVPNQRDSAGRPVVRFFSAKSLPGRPVARWAQGTCTMPIEPIRSGMGPSIALWRR